MLRLVTPNHSSNGTTGDEPDRMLDVNEAAKLLGMTPAQLKRRRGLPFAKSLGRRTVRYSLHGIQRYLRRAT